MNTRTTKILKWIGIASIVIAILYVILLILANRSLAKAYAALEADGRPMSAEEVIPAKIPDADNAALLYEAAVLQLKGEKAGRESLFERLSEISQKMLRDNPEAETIKQFRELIQRKPTLDALALIEQGTLKPACRYDLDYSKGPLMKLAHLSSFRDVSRILCAMIRLQILDGDYETAWRTVMSSLRFADILRGEPLLISQLVRASQFQMVADTIEALCLASAPTDAQFGELTKLIMNFEDNTPFIAAMDSERLLLGEWMFSMPILEVREALGEESEVQGLFTLYAMVPPLFHRDYAAYLHVMHKNTQNISSVYTEKDNEFSEELFGSIPRYCFLTRLVIPSTSQIKLRFNAIIARARITRAGLSALHYRQDHGTFPKTLATMNLQDLVDPFLGKPLHYSVTPTGFAVYSIGENLVDDGGVQPKKTGTGDIAWEFRGNVGTREN